MIHVLYSGTTSETGRSLTDALRNQGVEVVGGTRPPAERVDLLVRWGNSETVARRPARVLNTRGAVAAATNKLQSLLQMAERGVTVPLTYPVVGGTIPTIERFPVLGRRTNHTQGRDVVLCLQPADLPRALARNCTHFTQLIPKLKEFRVHVFRGNAVKLSEKVLTTPDNYDPVVWNFDNGFTFREPRDNAAVLLDRIKYLGVLAVQTLGLDFGAADIILAPDTRLYVLEVNTGPSLAENSLDVYVNQIIQFSRNNVAETTTNE